MIHVYAIVRTRPGLRARALECYRTLVPAVLSSEPGCLEYVPTTDVDLGLANQDQDGDMIFVAERWRTVADFRAHLERAHSIAFRAAIAGCLAEPIRLRITQRAVAAVLVPGSPADAATSAAGGA